MKLSEAQQTFIVQRLACWSTPSKVVEAVAEKWPETRGHLHRRQVHKYDPGRAGKKPAERWVRLFLATREAFLRETAAIGIVHQSYRLQELMDLFRRAKAGGNLAFAASLLEQAAKEVGGMYVNRRNVAGRFGDPPVSGVLKVASATDTEEWATRARAHQNRVQQDRAT